MHEGEWSSRLGIPGHPAEAEELMVVRDIALARLTGARVHFQHLSTAGSVDLVREAKAGGPGGHRRGHARTTSPSPTPPSPATTRCSRSTRRCGRRATSPPCKAGLADGTIDAIATDHAPHAQEAKEQPFDQAPPGMLGLETALALALAELGPADRAGPGPAVVAAGRASPAWPTPTAARRRGRPANLCVIDPAATWTVDPARAGQPQPQQPYAGRKLTGRVRHTVLRGEPVVIDGEAQR